MRSPWLPLLVVCLLAGPTPAAPLHVPIYLQQLRPEYVPVDVPMHAQRMVPEDDTQAESWMAEPVSVGVPFAVEEGITSADQLGMWGTRAAQFRVLQTDPETGHVTWALATFLNDGGPYAIVSGSGAFGGPPLAAETTDRFWISTGAAQFEVRKHGFNLLDRVIVVGLSEPVQRHASGGVVVLRAGTRYESGYDAGSEVVLEENGPVTAVVRACGTLRSAGGATALDYTVRLHFYKGASFCRAFVTLRNADIAAPASQEFDAAWVELPLRLVGDREVAFGVPGSGFVASIPPEGTAHLFQGDNTFQRSSRTDRILPYLTSARGLEVSIGGTTYNALGTRTDVACGWMRVRDHDDAVFAGMRDMASQFPSGFDLQNGLIAVELFSRYNPNSGLIFSWGAHETREMLFCFTRPTADPELFRARLQYPLIGKCDFARYRDTGGIYGERRLVTAEEETQFYAELGKTWKPERFSETAVEYQRQYSFNTTGGGNQFDQDECRLLDFLRAGDVGVFQRARLGALWKADQAVAHSDDFDYGEHHRVVSDVDHDNPPTFHGDGAGSQFDDEHPHWVCMRLYYQLTGDEHVREAIEDYGEWRLYRAGHPTYGPIYGGGIGHMRMWSRAFRDVALLYEFTGQQRYLNAVRTMANVLTTTIETDTSRGRSLERGYFYFGDEVSTKRGIHLFYLTEINGAATREAMRVLPCGDPLREELRDYMYGVAWFTLQEAQIDPDARGYPYQYYTAAPNPSLGTRGDQTGTLLTHGFEMSGDLEFVTRGRELAWRVAEDQNPLHNSDLSTHARIYRWIHRAEVGAAYLDVSASRNPDGSYTLHWTAPAGAREYVVKYGAKPLLENLGFDPVQRQHLTDPETAMNFWAATNLAGEPTPGAPGTVETLHTPVLPGGTLYFAVKALTTLSNSSPALHGVDPRLFVPNSGGQRRSDAAGPHPPGTGDRRSGPAASGGHVRVDAAPGVQDVRFSAVPAGAVLRVYDVTGGLVREMQERGTGEVVWDRRARSGGRVASGVYLYSVEVGSERTQRGRFFLVR